MRDGVAIITGGGTGIGAATALELAGAGMRVAVIGRRPEPLAGVVAEVVARWGRIDVVVSNAALHDVSSVASGDPAWWRQVVETNVLGGMNMVRAALPEMYRRESGHLVIVASVSGRVTYVGEPVYVASKHALVAFAECVRQEVCPRGLRVTLIEPGLVETPFIDNPFARELKKTVPPLQPEDCARAIRFALEQPAHCAINEIVLRPVKQVL